MLWRSSNYSLSYLPCGFLIFLYPISSYNIVPLNIEEEQRRTDLVHKLTQGVISPTEAQELRTLLKKERHMIAQQETVWRSSQ